MKRISIVAIASIAACGCANGAQPQGFAQDASTAHDATAADSATPPVVDSGVSNDDSAPPPTADSAPPPVVDSGTTVCPAPTANTDALPFAIDVGAKFVPSGYEGDATGNAITMTGTDATPACAVGRSSATAMGICHTVVYQPLAPGTPIGFPAGATALGWAAVVWQHPANNWGTQPGYLIPAGATKVSFWVRGASGGEAVKFFLGGTGFGATPTAEAPCADPLNASSTLIPLTKTWTQVTIPLAGAAYASGVLSGFGFAIAASDQGDAGAAAADAGATDGGADGGASAPAVTFYVDDIEWQN